MRDRVVAVVVLLLLAPVAVDFVFGATQVSTAFGLVPETLTYGVAAVLIRDVVRSRGQRWPAVVLLGVGFGIAVECLIVQTSLAPPGVGRALGVNWPYLVWAVPYEAVWAIVLPIQVTELLLPRLRDRPWLSRSGRLIFSVLLLLGGVVAWHTWTRVVRTRFLHLPRYDPPWPALAVAGVIVVAIVVVALTAPALRRPYRVPVVGAAPSPWLTAAFAVVASVLWFVLTLFAHDIQPWRPLPSIVPLSLAVVLAVSAVALLSRWSRAENWGDRHRLGLIAGALVASSGCGFVANRFTSGPDLVGKILLDLAALALVGWLTRRSRP